MSDLRWPFFEDRHRAFAAELDAWPLPAEGGDLDARCRALVTALGAGGWLRHCVGELDVRTLCLAREALARKDALADFAFAMQGLGSGAISLYGSGEQRERVLPRVASGELIAAFALSEPEAGSDVAAMAATADADGLISGTKTWISNGGLADFYTVFARGPAGITAYLVEADAPGLRVAERIDVMAPPPLATLEFDETPGEPLGDPGRGMRIALG